MKKENLYVRALNVAREAFNTASDETRELLINMFPGKLSDDMSDKLSLELILKEEIKSLKTELGKWKSYSEEQNNEIKRLKEKVQDFNRLKKENENLRKDFRKSDWYIELQTRLKAAGLKNRELMDAVGRLNRQLIQFKNNEEVYQTTKE